MDLFPDHRHFLQLQRDLWRWPQSRAALMVGAGVSLNADRNPGASQNFPLWNDLAKAMFELLHPRTNESQAEYENKFKGLNPIRIASEFEAAFGTVRLHQLLKTKIPDGQFRPGAIHQLTLELPWRDVFTVNYDTLLERTETLRRAYHIVTMSSELLHATSPRIIKLHGSFPSQTPFIITEEDFRTYPNKFAPFVNTVRQSLMENTFVMLGFSGDDPNFLAWSGWIRDELGSYRTPIYLVGALDLTDPQRALLFRRDITPIDLSPLFRNSHVANGKHAAALEWFLRSLHASKPPSKTSWPRFETDAVQEDPALPPLLTPHSIAPVESGMMPQQPFTQHQLIVAYRRWCFEREQYPGWVVAPKSVRMKIWRNTDTWMWFGVPNSKSLSVFDRLLLFREMNWRIEVAHCCLVTPQVEAFAVALNESWELLRNPGSKIEAPFLVGEEDRRTQALDAWMELALAVAREAREMFDASRWGEWMSKLKEMLSLRPAFADRIHYERILYSLWNVDLPTAKAEVLSWRPNSDSIIFQIRRASVLAELNELDEARALLRGTLKNILLSAANQDQNIALLSAEGWCMYLLAHTEMAADAKNSVSLWNQFETRFDELSSTDCDPNQVLDYFNGALSPIATAWHSDENRQVHSFDPGVVHIHSGFNNDSMGPRLPAFGFIRLFEEAGIPMYLRRINLFGETLSNACRWIAPLINFWSPALLVRARRPEDIRESDHISRPVVALMDKKRVAHLYEWASAIFDRELKTISSNNANGDSKRDLFEIVLEVLSRLAFRLDDLQLETFFQRLLSFELEQVVRSNSLFSKLAKSAFVRVFVAASPTLLEQWLLTLTKSPLTDGSFDPTTVFPFDRIKTPLNNEDLTLAVDQLFKRTAAETGAPRQRGLLRLISMYHCGLLVKSRENDFGTLLWAERRPDGKSILPFQNFSNMLHLPFPADVDLAARIKASILAIPASDVVKVEGGNLNFSMDSHDSFILEVSRASKPVLEFPNSRKCEIVWTETEAKSLFQRVFNWWQNNKIAAKGDTSFHAPIVRQVNDVLAHLDLFLGNAVFANISSDDDNFWIAVTTFLNDLRNGGVYATSAMPFMLTKRPERSGEVLNVITADLDSTIEEAVENAAVAVHYCILLTEQKKIVLSTSEILSHLIRHVAFREPVGIQRCMNVLGCLLIDCPSSFSLSQVTLLADSLKAWDKATMIESTADNVTEFAVEDRPDLRKWVSRLVAALNVWGKRASPEVVFDSVSFWESKINDEVLPEVRHAYFENLI